VSDKEKDARMPEKAHKPRYFSSLKPGNYKLETCYRYYENSENAIDINGKNQYASVEDLYLVLNRSSGKNRGIYTAVIENDFYLYDYVSALLRSNNGGYTLDINDSAYELYDEIKQRLPQPFRNFPTFGTTVFLLRLDKEQAYLLPEREYMVNDISISNSAVKVKLSFNTESGIKNVLLSAFVDPINQFDMDTAPYVLRLHNFFDNRRGYPLSVLSPIPVIINATNFSEIAKNLHGLGEKPVFKKGEVYVLDQVSAPEGNPHLVAMTYHEFGLDERVSQLLKKPASTITTEEMNILRKAQHTFYINTFADSTRKARRTQSDVLGFFNDKLNHGSRLFSTFDENIYANTMDFMEVPNDGNPTKPIPLLFKYYPDPASDPSREKLRTNVEILSNEAMRKDYYMRILRNGYSEIQRFPKRVP